MKNSKLYFSTVLTMGIVFLMTTGCSRRISNSISRTILECGSESPGEGEEFFKVLDPEGHELGPQDILVLSLGPEGVVNTNVPVSSRGCIASSHLEDKAVIVRSKRKGQRWGRILKPGQFPWHHLVYLEDLSKAGLRVACEKPVFTESNFRLPVEFQSGTDLRAYAVTSTLKRSGFEQTSTFALKDDPKDWNIQIPAGSDEGEYELLITIQDLLDAGVSDSPPETKCRVIVDRTKPVPQVSLPAARSFSDTPQVEPGSFINVAADDAALEEFYYCLRLQSEPHGCQDPENFSRSFSSTYFPAPEQGRWDLVSFARDKAGNVSDRKVWPFSVVNQALIGQIRSLADQSESSAAEDGLLSSIHALRAAKMFDRLVLPEERAEVENRLTDMFINISSKVMEHNRVQSLKGSLIAIAPGFAEPGRKKPFWAATSQGIWLYDADGNALDSLNQSLSSWTMSHTSPDGEYLVLFTKTKSFIYRQVDRTIRLLPLSQPDDDIQFTGASWSADGKRLALFGHNGLYIWSVLGDSLRLEAQLEDSYLDAEFNRDGSLLAVAYEAGSVEVGSYSADGFHATMRADIGGVLNLKFIAPDPDGVERLLVIDDVMRIHQWKVGSSAPLEVVNGLNQVKPFEPWETLPYPDIFDLDGKGRALVRRRDDFVMLQWEASQLKVHEISSTQLPKTAESWFWSPEEKLLASITPSRVVTYLWNDKWSGGRFLFQGSYSAGSESFYVGIDMPDLAAWKRGRNQYWAFLSDSRRWLTYGLEMNQVRIWNSEALQLEKIADTSSLSNLNLKWMDAPGGELLSAAGYDGIARFWDEQGQLKLELPHIPDELTDQPDITLSPDKSSWLAVLANGSGFLYNTAGTLIDSLIRPSIANTMADLDSTASAVISSDGSAIVMSGRYDHIIWKKGSDGRFTFHGTFNFGHGYCTHLRAQKFQWKGRDVFLLCGRAADFDGYKLGFFDEEGKPVQALSGSHEIGNVQAFQLSQGGKRLAVIQKRKPLVIYDLDATQGFIPEAVSAPSDLQWGKVISLKWSTDQNQLVGVFRGEKLVNWRYQDGGFKVAATRALPMDSNIDENPFRSVGWFPRTLRFFYFDLGELFILNDRLEVEHQIKGFERNLDISSLAISHEKEIIAMALGNRIRITRFDLKDIRAKFCAALAPYLQLSEDFDRRAGLSPEDRNLCR